MTDRISSFGWLSWSIPLSFVLLVVVGLAAVILTLRGLEGAPATQVTVPRPGQIVFGHAINAQSRPVMVRQPAENFGPKDHFASVALFDGPHAATLYRLVFRMGSRGTEQVASAFADAGFPGSQDLATFELDVDDWNGIGVTSPGRYEMQYVDASRTVPVLAKGDFTFTGRSSGQRYSSQVWGATSKAAFRKFFARLYRSDCEAGDRDEERVSKGAEGSPQTALNAVVAFQNCRQDTGLYDPATARFLAGVRKPWDEATQEEEQGALWVVNGLRDRRTAELAEGQALWRRGRMNAVRVVRQVKD